jgi:hypothetical protein
MPNKTAFVAYGSAPAIVGETIDKGIREFSSDTHVFEPWRETEIAGRFLTTEILEAIDRNDYLVADVSQLNFNVTYEIGYAIGKGKPILLILHSAVALRREFSELGIFDTIGYLKYQNSSELDALLHRHEELSPLYQTPAPLNHQAPVYLLDAKHKTDLAVQVVSRIKKARLFFRSFDPNEQARLSPYDSIRNVSQSYGIITFLLGPDMDDHELHNLRAAFIAGLAHGMGKVLCLLQFGDKPVPIDCRDLVQCCLHPAQVDTAVADFATHVTEALQTGEVIVAQPATFLQRLNLGASAAENEVRSLANYYLETDAFKRALAGGATLIVGRKGSGKTAIFFQVRDRVRKDVNDIVLDLKPEG